MSELAELEERVAMIDACIEPIATRPVGSTRGILLRAAGREPAGLW